MTRGTCKLNCSASLKCKDLRGFWENIGTESSMKTETRGIVITMAYINTVIKTTSRLHFDLELLEMREKKANSDLIGQ